MQHRTLLQVAWCATLVQDLSLRAGSQRVLSTSRDDTLRIWDAKQDLNELVSMRHYNNTGRWVVPFRAVWGPASDTVICGSMKRTVRRSSILRLGGNAFVERHLGRVFIFFCLCCKSAHVVFALTAG